MAGWVGQWRQGSFAVRALAHGGAAISARATATPWLRATSLTASLAGDVIISRVAGTPRRRRGAEVAINTADLLLWSWLAGPGTTATRPAVIGTVVPTALETGFRLAAGTEAVPVVEPRLDWEPAWDPPLPRMLSLPWSGLGRPGGWHRLREAATDLDGRRPRPRPARFAQLSVELARDIGLPLAALAAARRIRGERIGPGPLGWAAFAAVGGYALGRTRDDAQRSTRDLWTRRTAETLEEQRVASKVQSVLVHNVALDPKSVLVELKRCGSARAGTVLAEVESAKQAAWTAGVEGATLVQGAEGRPIEPIADQFRWITNAQVRQLRLVLNELDARAERATRGVPAGLDLHATTGEAHQRGARSEADDTLTVLSTRGPDVIARYRGEAIRLPRPVPDLVVRLEPTIPALGVGAVWTALAAVPGLGGAPVGAIAAAVGLQGAAIWRLATKTALERRADRTVAVLLAAGTVVVDLSVGLTQDQLVGPGGVALCPGTGATQAMVLLLACNWQHLRRERWWLAAVGGGAWAFSLLAAGQRDVRTFANELAFLIMPAAAAATVGADTRREAEALDLDLDAWLAFELDAAARAVAQAEVDRFVGQLRAVLDELPQYRTAFEPEEVAAIERSYRAEIVRCVTTDPLEVINWW